MIGSRLRIHATAVAIDGRAVLLRGAPGAGKSDLALRLIDAGALLVADDQSELFLREDALIVRPPATIPGLIEVRGLGIMRVAALAEAPVAMIVDLVAAAKVERMPERRSEIILGVSLPLVELSPFEASAPIKLRLALRAFTRLDPRAMLEE